MIANAQIRLGLTGLLLLGALAGSADARDNSTGKSPAGKLRGDISDTFNGNKLDTAKWWMKQAHEGTYRIVGKSKTARDSAIAISANPAMRGCGEHCQRNEIRTAPKYRIKFGQEAIYSFDFRVDGAQSTGRWVSGQWKQQCDGSPFLAQRFNRDEFYITVQDRNCRVVVASSKPSGARLPMTRKTDGLTQRVAPQPGTSTSCQTDIRVEYAADATLPDPRRGWVRMSYRVRGGRNGDGLIEINANGRFIARVTGSIGDDDVAGPNQYFKYGIYREFTRGTSTAYMDNFSRRLVARSSTKLARR